MNKAFMVGLSLALILSLSACGNSAAEEGDNGAQDTSTPEVTQPVDTSTPEVEQTAQTTQETPAVEETPTAEETPTVEETPAPAETTEQFTPEVQLFTDCNETVYATTTVNVRDTYSTSGNKVGSLAKAQSVTRTGTGQGEAAGWSRIEFNGQVAYVNSDYLSTTKPQVSTSSGSGGSSSNSGSTQTSKPSTSKPSTSKPSTSKPSTSKPSTSTGSSTGNTGKPFDDTPGIEWTTGNETLDEDDMVGDGTGNNDDSNVGGWYDPSTGEFFQ